MEVKANKVRLSSDFQEMRAVGAVRLRVDALRIQADAASFFPSTRMLRLSNAKLHLPFPGAPVATAGELFINARHGQLRLHRFQLELPGLGRAKINGRAALCRNGTCFATQVEASLCAHENPGYRLAAERAVLYPSGAADIEKAVLFIHEKRVLALPKIHLRPPGKPGFTMPKLGFDTKDGLVLGAGGLVPLSADTYLEGAFAVRPLRGFETRTVLKTPGVELKIDQLFIHPDNLLRLRLKTAESLGDLFFASDIDWLEADRRIIDNLTENYLDRALTRASSRLFFSLRKDFAVLEAAVQALQVIDADESFARSDPSSPTVRVTLGVPPIPLGAYFFAAANAQLIRRGPWERSAAEASASDEIPPHIRAAFEVTLAYIRKVGPLSITMDLATRHQWWTVDAEPSADSALHLAGGALNLAFPLFRDFKKSRHILSPYVAYRIVPGAWGHTPDFSADRFDLLRKGHGIEAGLSTSVLHRGTEIFRLDLFEKIAMNGFDASGGASYLAVRGRFGRPFFYAAFDAAWDQKEQSVSVLGLSVHRSIDRIQTDTGIRRLAPGNGPHRDRLTDTAFVPWLANTLFSDAAHAVEVFQTGELPLSSRIGLFAGIRGEIYPSQTLHALWYGLKLQSDCGCISLSLTASHRVSTGMPDIFTALRIRGL